MLYQLVKTTLFDFFRELPLIHGAALAYYALLALIPLLYLSVTLFGWFIGHDKMLEIIEGLLHDYIGIEDSTGIMAFLNDVDLGGGDLFLQVTGGVMVVFSCTAILNSLRKSINKFYGIQRGKRSTKKVIIRSVLFRLISMAVIVGATVILVVLYFAETVFLSLGNKFFEDLELLNVFFSGFSRHALPIVTNIILFSFIFKYLHDGIVKWRVAIRGAAATGFLLYLGQLFIIILFRSLFLCFWIRRSGNIADASCLGLLLFLNPLFGSEIYS